MTEEQLENQLRALAGTIEAPHAAVTDDVARGQRAARGRRVTVMAGAAAACAAIAVVSVTLPGVLDQTNDRPAPYTGDGKATPLPGPDPTPKTPEDGEVVAPFTDPNAGSSEIPGMGGPETMYVYLPEFKKWNNVLAEHLDPQRLHLEKVTKATINVQSSSTIESAGALGSRFGWTNSGESGLGMLQISVAAGWPYAEAWCESTCAPITVAGSPRALTYESNGSRSVAVERGDGLVVTLTTDALFGNNSIEPVAGMDLSIDDLAEAAADPKITLSNAAPIAPFLAPELLKAAAQGLALKDEEFRVSSGPSPSSATGFGDLYRDGEKVGELNYTADPRAGIDELWCYRNEAIQCIDRTIDGQTVRITQYKNSNGGGWSVYYLGDSTMVEVRFTPVDADTNQTIKPDRALPFVLNPAWQG